MQASQIDKWCFHIDHDVFPDEIFHGRIPVLNSVRNLVSQTSSVLHFIPIFTASPVKTSLRRVVRYTFAGLQEPAHFSRMTRGRRPGLHGYLNEWHGVLSRQRIGVEFVGRTKRSAVPAVRPGAGTALRLVRPTPNHFHRNTSHDFDLSSGC